MSALTPVSVFVAELISQIREQVPAQARLSLNSRDISAGDVFVACPGLNSDGRHFIADAVARGAAAVICEHGLSKAQTQALRQVPCFEVQGLRACLGELGHQWWGKPSGDVQVIAVTGTNGKTTTSQLIGAALRAAGHPSAVLGTLGLIGTAGELVGDASLTTPDVLSVHQQIAKVRDTGARYLMIEASSIGLDQGRLDGVQIHTAIFTNLTQDHLDYHSDMKAYAQAKARLFARPELVHAILNVDDAAAQLMQQETTAKVTSFGVTADADWSAESIEDDVTGLQFVLKHRSGQSILIQSGFIGRYNVSNMLAVAAALGGLGWSFDQVARGLEHLPAVRGRMEPVTWPDHQARLPLVLVDYAHTPDALTNALGSVRDIARARQGKIFCVAGCGGDRDRTKRQPMGAALSAGADWFVVTSDNPRSEDPWSILQEVWMGVTHPTRGRMELDREVAILSAIWAAGPNDVVLIAGKGHETYQLTGNVRRTFDDRQWARLALLFYGDEQGSPVPPVFIDSRQVTPGSLFVAIAGDRFDGHDFLADVSSMGARAALVCRPQEQHGLEQVVVDDTRSAMQSLARAWRERFDLPVIGVTGSNGKTTTKEMISAILSTWVGQAQMLATQGNLNNDLGVPLTLLRLRAWHQAAVVELGMNHPGEIELLARLTQPTVGLVLNAQREHQEFMHSVKAVAVENGQVLAALSPASTAVFMDQPPYTALWSEMSAHVGRRWTFGFDEDCDIRASDMQLQADSSRLVLSTAAAQTPVTLQVPGAHNVLNALASAACALAAGASLDDVARGLESFRAVTGRMHVHRLSNAQVLIDDSYNANPDSVRAAIDVLSALERPRALVLGDMGEVGQDGPAMHREIGCYAREQKIDYLLTLGTASLEAAAGFGSNARSFDSVQALTEHLEGLRATSMLVKGSRFMALERVVKTILAQDTSTNNKNTGEHGHAG